MDTVTVIYPGGRATFARKYLESFGSFEALEASPVLDGIKGRKVILKELYLQSHPVQEEKSARGTKRTGNKR